MDKQYLVILKVGSYDSYNKRILAAGSQEQCKALLSDLKAVIYKLKLADCAFGDPTYETRARKFVNNYLKPYINDEIEILTLYRQDYFNVKVISVPILC